VVVDGWAAGTAGYDAVKSSEGLMAKDLRDHFCQAAMVCLNASMGDGPDLRLHKF
jgi:hypothetical protein